MTCLLEGEKHNNYNIVDLKKMCETFNAKHKIFKQIPSDPKLLY